MKQLTEILEGFFSNIGVDTTGRMKDAIARDDIRDFVRVLRDVADMNKNTLIVFNYKGVSGSKKARAVVLKYDKDNARYPYNQVNYKVPGDWHTLPSLENINSRADLDKFMNDENTLMRIETRVCDAIDFDTCIDLLNHGGKGMYNNGIPATRATITIY